LLRGVSARFRLHASASLAPLALWRQAAAPLQQQCQSGSCGSATDSCQSYARSATAHGERTVTAARARTATRPHRARANTRAHAQASSADGSALAWPQFAESVVRASRRTATKQDKAAAEPNQRKSNQRKSFSISFSLFFQTDLRGIGGSLSRAYSHSSDWASSVCQFQ